MSTSSDTTAVFPVTVQILRNGMVVDEVQTDASGNWRYNATLAVAAHTFTARSGNSTSTPWSIEVIDAAIDAKAPYVEEASDAVGNRQELDYYNVNRDIHVVVPDYTMQTGDSVKVYWVSRNTTDGSEIQTVVNPPKPLRFTISKYEVIDAIGFADTRIYYTVRRPPAAEDVTSRSLTLSVTGNGHTRPVLAPTLNEARNNLRVMKADHWNAQTTVRVRAIGKTEWESSVQRFEQNAYLNFPINSIWLAANRGESVLFNYSLQINESDAHYLLSQLLRINPL